MTDSKTPKTGFKNPPEHTQFKKGRSGNPKGRPKRIDDPYTTIEKVLARRVAVTGENRKIPIREALLRRLRERALEGNKRAFVLHQKILKLAADATPPHDQAVDIMAVKLKFAKMAGISIVDQDQDHKKSGDPR